MHPSISTYLSKNTKAAPLAVFRVFFGILMVISLVRFWSYGWIQKFYISPDFHFKYFGFSWVQPLGQWTYLLFFICLISALFIAIGYKYRVSSLLFFLTFTYIELIDKTTYLNHYYFVSVLSFLLIFVPAHSYFSVDALRGSTQGVKFSNSVPKWCVDSIKLMLSIVYFYAGLAKLNSDWLLEALPLKIWLPSKFDTPVIGHLVTQEWVAYAFSWTGAIYDLAIPFLLLFKPTRKFAFFAVVVFHVLTRVLFPIGMFPYIMIVSTLIFFDSQFHEKVVSAFAKALKYPLYIHHQTKIIRAKVPTFAPKIVCAVLVLQLLLPWRYIFYPGELFWTEEGYRFSWRVMLMEKAGYAQFKIVDGVTGKRFYVDNSDFLTPLQEKQMSFQPDFILEYAHNLRDHFEAQGHQKVKVYGDVKVALNGRLSTVFVDPNIDLAKEEEGFKHKNWIIPFNDEIKGL